MQVKCVLHPELHIYDLNVRFKKGVADVSDAEVLRALQGMESYGYGFTFSGDIPDQKPEPSPFAKMSGVELDAKAKELGVDLAGCKNKAEKIAAIEAALAGGGGANGDPAGNE